MSELATRACVLMFAVLACSACAKKDRPDDVLHLLTRCPAWTRITPDRASTTEIVACLAEISMHPVDEIRTSVVEYASMNSQNLDDLSKLFLLNRFLFNVPQWVDSQVPAFGSWHAPVKDGKAELLWPFSTNSSGNLRLTGIFRGYTGEPYRAVDEFDYFRKEFGIRTMGPKVTK